MSSRSGVPACATNVFSFIMASTRISGLASKPTGAGGEFELTGVPAGRSVDRFGAQRITVSGLVGMVIGSSALGLAPASLGIAGYAVPIIVVTASYALFQTANNSAVMTDVPPDQRGVISGMLNLSRNLGLITGASVMGAVFALASRASQLTAASQDAIATGMQVTFAVAAALVVIALAIALASPALSRALSSQN